MANLIFIVAEGSYNFEIKVRIDSSMEGSPEAVQNSQKKVYLKKSGITFSKIDWGDGSTDLTELNHSYSQPGEYVIKGIATRMSKELDLEACNITEVVKIPGIIGSSALNMIPTSILLNSNKFPSGGLVPLLNRLKQVFPDNVQKLSHTFRANGQMGHTNYEADSGRSKIYVRGTYNIPYLVATADEIANTKRTQEELNLGWDLINKGWFVQMSFDDAYRVSMPKNAEDIFHDGEMGEVTIGVEMFHVVFTQEGNKLKSKLVRRNMRNGYYNDERMTRDTFRKIVPQELYLRYQFKKPGESGFGHDLLVKGAETDPKNLQEINLDPSVYPDGTVVRAVYLGKWYEHSAVGNSSDLSRSRLMSTEPFEITIKYV